jgi:L-ascorbate metabolism protein UlaG (beta-lactamase superfamily)
MDIRWFGQSFFEITADTEAKKGLKIYIDPFGDVIGIKPPSNLEGDAVLITHGHPDHNNLGAFKSAGLAINTPGEYSVGGADIKGLLTFHDDKSGTERGLNVVYILEAENIRVVHLGDIGQTPTEAQIQKIDGVDVLMIPAGGSPAGPTVAPKEAVKIIKQLEPKVVIPMHYKIPGHKATNIGDLDTFCKEMGVCATEPVKKISLKAGTLAGKEMEVIIMEPQKN